MPFRTPLGWFLSLSRVVVAIGAALALVAIVGFLFRGGRYGFAPSEVWISLWALFATFVLAIGVLVLYEIRDLLVHQVRQQAAVEQPVAGRAMPPATGLSLGLWRSIGWLASRLWLPFQPPRERLLLDHLALHEQYELYHRLAAVTACIVATTVMPIMLAFIFLSPVAVCFAATAIAGNLFVLDWFKKRHKRWLYSTNFAAEQGIEPPGE